MSSREREGEKMVLEVSHGKDQKKPGCMGASEEGQRRADGGNGENVSDRRNEKQKNNLQEQKSRASRCGEVVDVEAERATVCEVRMEGRLSMYVYRSGLCLSHYHEGGEKPTGL